jgi:ribosome modulation factor
MMNRQKRDREDRAHTRGYQAGISGRSKEHCPYQNDIIKSQWLGGWREAIEDKHQGLFK